MRYDEVRELLVRQWRDTGGPNEAKGSELYHDDAVDGGLQERRGDLPAHIRGGS